LAGATVVAIHVPSGTRYGALTNADGFYSINGMRPGGPYTIDALDQISVNITPYDVRQSNFIGASVNAVTRSGTNEFSGSVYSYMNNETFKGNKVGDATFTKTPASYKMVGLRLGGPIIKNKLFFFFSLVTFFWRSKRK